MERVSLKADLRTDSAYHTGTSSAVDDEKKSCESCRRRIPKTVSAPTMYTTPANLQETMTLQQELLLQGQTESGWKVKRRPDGTRYVSRAARSKLLKVRQEQIVQERAGITTDEDNQSELKTGRYWPKEERKKHLERAKERKKKEMMLRFKMAVLNEGSGKGLLSVTTV
ncbi:PDZ domain-containing RING finger protein 4-like [Ornithodoros turicata]